MCLPQLVTWPREWDPTEYSDWSLILTLMTRPLWDGEGPSTVLPEGCTNSPSFGKEGMKEWLSLRLLCIPSAEPVLGT